jgi:hypothetical protein
MKYAFLAALVVMPAYGDTFSSVAVEGAITAYGAIGGPANMVKAKAENRNEFVIRASGGSYLVGSRGAGISLYGNNDSQHSGNISFMTGPDDLGNSSMIISGHSDEAHVTVGRNIWDFVDEKRDVGALNVIANATGPAIHIMGAGAATGEISIPIEQRFDMGHVAGGAFTSRVGFNSLGGLEVNQGDGLYRMFAAKALLDFPSIAINSQYTMTIPVAGAVVGDVVNLGLPPVPKAGIVFNGFVSALGVVSIRASNITGAAVNPIGEYYTASVMGF